MVASAWGAGSKCYTTWCNQHTPKYCIFKQCK